MNFPRNVGNEWGAVTMFIYLDIVEQFSCKQCGECCNRDWLVTVDEAGYRRNEELFANAGKTAEFRLAFSIMQKGDVGEYARIHKKAGGACWFLTDGKLCSLQQVAGHEHLDSVCQWFPRYPMDTDRGIELSLSFSCPEALRLAMRETPLRIVRSHASPIMRRPTDFVAHVYPSRKAFSDPLRYYFELEGHLIDVLQERRLSLTARLELVRKTLTGFAETEGVEAPESMIKRLVQANYACMDSTDTDAAVSGPAEWLAENFFVNYIFRKNIYTKGLREAERTLAMLEERLRLYPGQAAEAEEHLATLQKTMVGLELELNHQSRGLKGACR